MAAKSSTPSNPPSDPQTAPPASAPAVTTEVSHGLRWEPLDAPPIPMRILDGTQRIEGARHVGHRAHDPRMDYRDAAVTAHGAGHGQIKPQRQSQEVRLGNLPTPGKFEAVYAEAEADARAAQGRAYAALGSRTRWVKVGIIPPLPGKIAYSVVMDQYDGEVLVKTLVKHGLTALGAREQLALHMVAMHTQVGL